MLWESAKLCILNFIFNAMVSENHQITGSFIIPLTKILQELWFHIFTKDPFSNFEDITQNLKKKNKSEGQNLG